MSGGRIKFYQIRDIIDKLEHLIETNEDKTLNEYGEMRGSHYTPETINAFREAYGLMCQAEVYAHRLDYLLAGDDSEEAFHKRLKEEIVDCPEMDTETT